MNISHPLNNSGNYPNDHIGYIILDFKDVQGMDSSAIHSFLKINQVVENGYQVKLIYSQLKPGLKNLFIKGSVLKGEAEKNVYETQSINTGNKFIIN